MMEAGIRWTVKDKNGNTIYLSEERWEHIIESINHPEMSEYEEELGEVLANNYIVTAYQKEIG